MCSYMNKCLLYITRSKTKFNNRGIIKTIQAKALLLPSFNYLWHKLIPQDKMNSKKFKLNVENNNPFQIQMFEKEKETHVLIRLTKGIFCDSMNVLLLENGIFAPKNFPAKALTILPLPNYPKFGINANFSSAKAYIDVEIYKGFWEEILLAEVEFSFSASPYFISCNEEEIGFKIGKENESNIEVKLNPDGGFDTTFTIVKSADQNIHSKQFFEEDSDGAHIIKRLYGRIKGRVKGAGFEERQSSFEKEFTENLNKTMLESYMA